MQRGIASICLLALVLLSLANMVTPARGWHQCILMSHLHGAYAHHQRAAGIAIMDDDQRDHFQIKNAPLQHWPDTSGPFWHTACRAVSAASFPRSTVALTAFTGTCKRYLEISDLRI